MSTTDTVRAHRFAASTASAHRVDALQSGDHPRRGAARATIDRNLLLSAEGLQSYFFARWDPVVVDLLVVAAAIEFCDVSHRRPGLGWSRNFDVRIAVHEPSRWRRPAIVDALRRAISFLTGDVWSFSFEKRRRPAPRVAQQSLDIDPGARVIMPYSDGLDSRAVAALVASGGAGLVRVRLGSGGVDRRAMPRRLPFTSVPYDVRMPQSARRESSARSRGFKFAVVTGVAAHLAKVSRIIVTESGQGAIGPALAVTGHAYPDYRVHPAFFRLVERLLSVLLEGTARFEFPRIWNTKGETLAAAAGLSGGLDWKNTRSCWQQSRQVSVAGHRRQCGVCAACILRRMSMHHAGIAESPETYVFADLSAPTLRASAPRGFSVTNAMNEYAIAGVLHMDHLAALAGSTLHGPSKRRVAASLAAALGIDVEESTHRLEALLQRHRQEWRSFLATLDARSFVVRLASVNP